MIGHAVACYGAADRYLGMLAATLGDRGRAGGHFEAALSVDRRDGRGHVDRTHGATSTPRLLRATGARTTRGAAASCSPRPRGSPSGSAWRRCSRACEPPGGAGRGAVPRACPREVEILRLVARGLSNREIGTDALDQRAHRRQPHAQHPAKDGRRESHRGRGVRPRHGLIAGEGIGRHAALHRRTRLRRAARSDERRRAPDRGGERRRGRRRWLFSFLSADRERSYCLYEAPSPDEILAAAKRNKIPADAIVEVNRLTPSLVT